MSDAWGVARRAVLEDGTVSALLPVARLSTGYPGPPRKPSARTSSRAGSGERRSRQRLAGGPGGEPWMQVVETLCLWAEDSADDIAFQFHALVADFDELPARTGFL